MRFTPAEKLDDLSELAAQVQEVLGIDVFLNGDGDDVVVMSAETGEPVQALDAKRLRVLMASAKRPVVKSFDEEVDEAETLDDLKAVLKRHSRRF